MVPALLRQMVQLGAGAGCRSVRLIALLVVEGCLLLLLAAPTHAQWQADQGLVIVGTVVMMNDAGDVLPTARVFIRDGKILAVAGEGEDLPPAAASAVVLQTDAFIYPGLIDLHNHPEYNAFPLW